MKIFFYLSAAIALLGACTTAPVAPSSGTATYNGVSDYTVIQDGVSRTLLSSSPRLILNNNGIGVWYWVTGASNISGYGRPTDARSAVAAGLDNGTYFAGISGSLSGTVPTSGTANYLGTYGFIVNGVDSHGALALTADFSAGTLVDTTAVIDVNGTISGANIGGTVTIGGETGTLTGGFYSLVNVAGAVVGANMSGIIVAD